MTGHWKYRRLRIALIVLGAITVALLPLMAGGASSPRFTDIEARLGYGAFAVLVHAAFGAAAGWAIGALVAHVRGER